MGSRKIRPVGSIDWKSVSTLKDRYPGIWSRIMQNHPCALYRTWLPE